MDELWWPKRVFASEVVYPPGGTYGPRVQRDYQIVLLHTGCLTLDVDNHNAHYDAGMALLLEPGRTEFFQFSKDSLTHHSWISFNKPSLPANWSEGIGRFPQAIPLSPRLHGLTQEAIYWVRCKHAEKLLLTIGYHALELFLREEMETANLVKKRHETVHLAEMFIRLRYKDDICLDDLCKQAAVSAEHLCRLFHTQYGISPMAYLWRYRTKRALELLAATGLSVSDIAECCGFKTPFHLHHRVKDLTGLSPTQYRKQCWSGSGVI